MIINAPLILIAIVDNFDCSRIITPQQADLPVAFGYKVLLANPLNNTQASYFV